MANPLPRPSIGPCSAVHGEELYLFGDTRTCGSSEIAVLDFTTYEWKSLATAGDVPRLPSGASVAVIGDCLYMFGGFVIGLGLSADLYELNLVSFKWRLLPSGPELESRPILKDKAGMVDYADEWLCVMGGYGSSQSPTRRQKGASYHLDRSERGCILCWTNEFHMYNVRSCKHLVLD